MIRFSIGKVQDCPGNIDLLRAQRQTYRDAKIYGWLQLIALVVVPIGGTFAARLLPGMQGFLALCAIIALLVDCLVLEVKQADLKRTAAKIQEQFDCDVLSMPWNPFVVGPKVDPEFIHRQAKRHEEQSSGERLMGWYPKIVDDVPIMFGRLICQRTNFRYDSALRRKYSCWALASTVILCFVIVLAGYVEKLTIESLVIAYLMPMAPIVVWGLREFVRQREYARRQDETKCEIDRLWASALSGACTADECLEGARNFQNALYERRAMGPLVFEFVYSFFRNELEDEMSKGAEHFVKEVQSASIIQGS